jgi:cell division protein FtsI/penicillin-binding protein 2
LIQDKDSPLLNRATLGHYPPGTALSPFILAAQLETGNNLPNLPERDIYLLADWRDRLILVPCMLPVEKRSGDIMKTWGDALSRGCPAEFVLLSKSLERQNLLAPSLQRFGFFSSPSLPLPVARGADLPEKYVTTETILGGGELPPAMFYVNPLQMARAAALISNAGKLPAPHLASEIRVSSASTWQPLPQVGNSEQSLSVAQPSVFQGQTAGKIADMFAVEGQPIWQLVAGSQWESPQNNPHLTWYLAGTKPGNEPAFALSLVLEENNPAQAVRIGQAILKAALTSYR